MSGDNGKLEKNPEGELQKTPEQLKEERLARYNSDPDSFIEINELICAAIRNPKSQLGISILVGNCKRSELNQAESEIAHLLRKARISMDIASEMRKEAVNNLITPQKNGIMNFARFKR
jgi:hypothetical protein